MEKAFSYSIKARVLKPNIPTAQKKWWINFDNNKFRCSTLNDDKGIIISIRSVKPKHTEIKKN